MFGRLLATDRVGPQAVSNGIKGSPPFSFLHNDISMFLTILELRQSQVCL